MSIRFFFHNKLNRKEVTDESTFSLINRQYEKVVEPGTFVLTIAKDSQTPVLNETVFVD